MIEESKLQTLVEKVIDRLKSEGVLQTGVARFSQEPARGKPPVFYSPKYQSGKFGLFERIDDAVKGAWIAHHSLMSHDLALREKVLHAMRNVTMKINFEISKKTVEETGLGRVEDKVVKNKLVVDKTPGMEILLPKAFTGDHGLTLMERAPYGVICSITPCTNATETILNNALGMIAGGNAVVFNPHPSAKNVSIEYIRALNEAIVHAGGPDNLICMIGEPTIESATELMKHRDTKLVVVTGGPAVVKAAMALGKKVIGAGPGNPPVVVDETAHIDKAAKDIIAGASLDNNIVCIVEKEIIAVDAVADKLKEALVRHGAYHLKDAQINRLEKIIVEDGHPVKKFIGKNVNRILETIGISVSDQVRIAFCEVDESHPFVQLEMLLPVIPLVRVRNVEEAIETAVRVEHGFKHTAVMHSTNIEHLHRMACRVDTSIFVKNAPSFAGLGLGGEGYTSWTIASPTGEGLTTAINFTRERRCTLKDYFRIV